MPRMSAAMEHALKVLGDGKWHSYERALYEVSKGVPPNLAVRRAERNRILQWVKEHPGSTKDDVPPRRPGSVSTDRLVRWGSRDIARSVLLNQRFEHVRHKETKHRLIRILPLNAPTPPPEGYEHFKKRHSKFQGMSAEEIREFNSNRTKKAIQTRLKRQGIDPSTHVTKAELERRRKEWYASLTDEQRAAMRSEATRKSWKTKRERQAQKGGTDGEVSDSG